MAGVKISALPAVPSAQLTDFFPVVQAGVTSQETLQQVATLFGFSGGILSLAHGGTNANLTASNGGVVYSTATALAILSGTATANQVLLSGATAAPTWSTATFASTYAASSILYSNGANTVQGLATANSSSLVTTSAGVPIWVGPMTNGQLVIGSTGATPVVGNIAAGPGISVANGAGTITISGTGSGIGWTDVTGTSQAMAADNGYVSDNAGLVTLTLPATAAFGTAISVLGKGAGGWKIAQNAGQNIQVGSSSTTVGVGGSVASTNRFDSIDLICTTANTTWTTLGGVQGILTIV
jgi:hypothetical protein